MEPAQVLPPNPAHRERNLITRAALGWDRFWFTNRPNTVITAVRFALGFVVFAWGLSWLADLDVWLGDDAILPRSGYRDERIALFRYWYSEQAILLVYVLLMLGAICLMAGMFVKPAALVVWYGLLSMQLEAVQTLNAADGLLRIWAFYFALFALFTPSRLLRTPLLGLRDADGKVYWPQAPTWLLRIMQIQLTIIYPATVLLKIPGDTWREGTAGQYALGLEDFQRMWLPEFVRQDPWLGNLMTWGSLGIEFSLPFLLWTKRTRKLGIVLGLGMHLSFDYTMRLGFFLWAMVIGYLAFMTHDELARPLRWIANKFNKDGSVVDSSETILDEIEADLDASDESLDPENDEDQITNSIWSTSAEP